MMRNKLPFAANSLSFRRKRVMNFIFSVQIASEAIKVTSKMLTLIPLCRGIDFFESILIDTSDGHNFVIVRKKKYERMF